MEEFKSEQFESRLNEKFEVRHDGAAVGEAELIEFATLTKSPQVEAFSLIFRLPEEFGLVQGTFEFYHPETGAFHPLLVPVGQTEEGFKYEAIFSYLREAEA